MNLFLYVFVLKNMFLLVAPSHSHIWAIFKALELQHYLCHVALNITIYLYTVTLIVENSKYYSNKNSLRWMV
jgi:hypothetical protein